MSNPIDEAKELIEYAALDVASRRLKPVMEGLLKEISKRDKVIEAAETWSANWGLRRHVAGEIIVSHKDGSGVLLRDSDDTPVAESLFYRMMDEVLTGEALSQLEES